VYKMRDYEQNETGGLIADKCEMGNNFSEPVYNK